MDLFGIVRSISVWAGDLSILLFGSKNVPLLFGGGVLLFIGLPAAFLFSVYKIVKLVTEKGKIKDQKEILALEIEKQRNHLLLLEEENKKDGSLNHPSSEALR